MSTRPLREAGFDRPWNHACLRNRPRTFEPNEGNALLTGAAEAYIEMHLHIYVQMLASAALRKQCSSWLEYSVGVVSHIAPSAGSDAVWMEASTQSALSLAVFPSSGVVL